MTDPPPLQLTVGPPRHGVTAYGSDVASAVVARDSRTTIARARDVEDAVRLARTRKRVHLHVTDRLLGSSPEHAAENVERLAHATRLSITAHDLPQESDGRMRDRRVAAYARILAAAEATAVNSAHELSLVAEHLPIAADVRVIPLGSRVPVVPPTRPPVSTRPEGDARDLVVMIAGYVYPGKGHAAAVVAGSRAARALREAGHSVGEVIVRAVGAPSAGHEHETEELRTDAAAQGVRFDLTGFLDETAFAEQLVQPGIPLAAHEHISASRSMLDWVELGRRPLVVDSRYAAEMASLRPDTLSRYAPDALAARVADAWKDPGMTWLAPGTDLSPTVADAADDYLHWWQSMAAR